MKNTKVVLHLWVSDIRAKYYASRNALIYRLHLLGWKQTEIVDTVKDINQPRVAQIINDFTEVKRLIITEFQQGKSPEEIAQYHSLDLPLTWAIILEGKSDLERFKLFGKSEYGNDAPEIFNVWNYAKRDS